MFPTTIDSIIGFYQQIWIQHLDREHTSPYKYKCKQINIIQIFCIYNVLYKISSHTVDKWLKCVNVAWCFLGSNPRRQIKISKIY